MSTHASPHLARLPTLILEYVGGIGGDILKTKTPRHSQSRYPADGLAQKA